MAAAKKKKVIEFPGDAPTGKTRSFRVTVSKQVVMTLDTSVIAQGRADDGFIMKNPSEREVLEHLAFNLIGNQLDLSDIEGYANCPNKSADVTYEPWDIDDLDEIEEEEK